MAWVRVSGRPLHSVARVAGLSWSHSIEEGCLEASWTLSGVSRTGVTSFLRRGAKVEIFEGLERVWFGLMSEPGEDFRECVAKGQRVQADRYPCVTDLGVPTDNLNVGIESAIAMGWGVTYLGDAPTGIATEEPQTLSEALTMASTAVGKRATVRADGVLRFESQATTPRWIIRPGIGTVGRSDESFVTHVVVRYVVAVSGTPPVPSDWGTVTASDDAAAATYGRSQMYVNLEDRGVLSETVAQGFADGLLNLAGVRLAFTNKLTVSTYDLRDVGLQKPNLATVTAGDMVRMLGVESPDSPSGRVLDFVISQTEHEAGSGLITLSPLGLVPRDIAEIVASIPTQGPSKIVNPKYLEAAS